LIIFEERSSNESSQLSSSCGGFCFETISTLFLRVQLETPFENAPK